MATGHVQLLWTKMVPHESGYNQEILNGFFLKTVNK